MKNSKLLELLSTFDQVEFERFQTFVLSPYFNKNEDLIRLVAYLETLVPELPEDKIEKEVVFAILFPDESFDKKKLAYLMNYLLKLGEQFLAIERYQKEEVLVNSHILDQFVDRKLDKHYHYLFHKTHDSGQVIESRSEQVFYNRYLMAKVATKHFDSKQVREFDPSLQMVANHLDDFYFFHKLKYSCEMLNRQGIISADYQLTFIAEVKAYLIEKVEIDPLIEIYLQIFLSISFPAQEEHFEKLMDLIKKYVQSLDQKIQREIYLYALNYCAPKIRQGEKYTSIMLNLYIEGIENRALFDGLHLSHWTFANVVKLALRLGRYEWIEIFIKDHVESLSPRLREDAEHYNLAELYYHKKEFDKVLTHLNLLQFTDLHYHLGSRVMLLKTYHELDAEDSLLSLLASFSVYLRRNKKVSLSMKKTYLNFCNLLHQLLRRNPTKWEALRKSIEEMQPLTERAWLLAVWERY